MISSLVGENNNDNDSYQLLNASNVPGTVLDILLTVSLVLTNEKGTYYPLHFTFLKF